jgi:DNA-binding response OmpR family regulator
LRADDSDHWPRAVVLVVGDEPGMRHFLAKALAPRVAQVLTAGSAAQAEGLLRQHHVNLVVLDIARPGQNGIALLKDLRARGEAAELVLITAFADLETAIEALRAGAGDMLPKPLRTAQVRGTVRHGLERARRRLAGGAAPRGGGDLHRAADGRIRHRPGTGRDGAAPSEPARGRALRAGELRHRGAGPAGGRPRARRTAPAWACGSAARWCSVTAATCGPPTAPALARCSPCSSCARRRPDRIDQVVLLIEMLGNLAE